MKVLVFVPAALYLPSACQRAHETEPLADAGPPNIVLILADDMGYTDIGAFGSEINTPNLDRLAYGGVRLSNFHVSPQCAPTRSMLLSGTDNHTAGMGSMFGANFIKGGFGDRPGYERYLHPRVATLAERLGDAGYTTLMSGKWHLGLDDDKSPTMRGFDKAFALLRGSASHMEMRALNNPQYRENGKLVESLPDDFYSTNFYTDKMIEHIESTRDSGKPFFGYLALTAPHWPMQAPPEFIDKYAGRYNDGYETLGASRHQRALELGVIPDVDPALFETIGSSWDDLDEVQQRYSSRKMEIYAAMVDNMDHNIGRLVDYLEGIGEFENTLFIFMSDNGAEADREDRNPTFMGGIRRSNYYVNTLESLGTATSWVNYGPGWAQAGMNPYRLFKGFLSEGGTRSSAFVYHPRLEANGTINDQYLTLMDVMPTLLDFAAVEFDPATLRGRQVEPMGGHSFRSILEGSDELVHPATEVIAFELHGQRALVRGDWKILWEQRPANIWWDDEEPAHWRSWRLYNLKDDPTEQNDLSDSEAELRDELVALWHQFAEENHVMESVTPYWPERRPQ